LSATAEQNIKDLLAASCASVATTPKTLQERLIENKAVYEAGFMDEDEYQKRRERILADTTI
jgi:hypothetical protein